MENTFGYIHLLLWLLRDSFFQMLPFCFHRNCVQQYKRHRRQSNVSTSQLQHPSERLPVGVAALRGDKGHECLQGSGHDRGHSQKGLEVTSHSEQNVTQPGRRNKSQWGQKDWVVKPGRMSTTVPYDGPFTQQSDFFYFKDKAWHIYCFAHCEKPARIWRMKWNEKNHEFLRWGVMQHLNIAAPLMQ